MGYRLVSLAMGDRVLGETAKVSLPAFVTLLVMARSALDTADEKDGIPGCLYFQGWAPIAAALGYPRDVRYPGEIPPNAKRAVARSMSELSEHGLIERLTPAPIPVGKRTCYRLNLERLR